MELFSEELTEEMQYMVGNLTDCETNPAGYKLCSPYTCVTMDTPCPCGPYEYTCANLRCIPDSRLCDLHNDCGDNSDEHMCNKQLTTDDTLSPLVMVGVVTGCVVFIIIIIVATIIYLKWKRRKRKTTEKTDDGTNNKEQHLHENKALVTSTSMEDSNELQTPKKGGYQTPTGYHTPFKDRYHVPLDFEEGLLCTSTPKQPLRQLLMTIKSIDDV